MEDKCSLQDKVDKLNFQLMLKEKDIKHDLARIEILERQNRELKEEIKKMEIEIAGKYNAVYALQEQIKLLKQQSLKAERRKKEIEQLQKKIEHYKKYVKIYNILLCPKII